MKIDKYIKAVVRRLDNISNGNDKSANSHDDDNNNNNGEFQDYDDEYYLNVGSEPLRFAYYRHLRIQNSKDEHRKKSCEAAYDTISQDELDYYLKAKLRVPPEQRYQDAKREPWFHELSWDIRGLNACDGKGCGGYTGCIEECRYYPEYGRIEDAELIAEHREAEEEHRRNNTIVNIDIDKKDFLEFAKCFYNR